MSDDTLDFLDIDVALAGKGAIFFYRGYITEPILTDLAQVIRRKLAVDAISRSLSQSIFSVFVEQLQNVIRYSVDVIPPEREPESDLELRHGTLLFGKIHEGYYVCCINKVLRKDVPRLRGKLEQLVQLDKDGMKKLHKETLRGEIPEGSKGAGVGLIDIAMRAHRGLRFEFRDIDDSYSLFALMACI